MSTPPATRALIRQSRFLLRRQNFRQASTTAETAAKAKDAAGEAASKAKDTASVVTSKASEGLSRVTSSAGSVVSGAASSAANALNSVGGRTGRAIAFVRDCKSYFPRRRLQCVKGCSTNQRFSSNTTDCLLLACRPRAWENRV
jgi:hypothetical protein